MVCASIRIHFFVETDQWVINSAVSTAQMFLRAAVFVFSQKHTGLVGCGGGGVCVNVRGLTCAKCVI